MICRAILRKQNDSLNFLGILKPEISYLYQSHLLLTYENMLGQAMGLRSQSAVTLVHSFIKLQMLPFENYLDLCYGEKRFLTNSSARTEARKTRLKGYSGCYCS